jgi:hypothetical protein
MMVIVTLIFHEGFTVIMVMVCFDILISDFPPPESQNHRHHHNDDKTTGVLPSLW